MKLKNMERDEGLQRAIALVNDCITELGFVASSTVNDNYRQIWGREGIIIGMAALMREDRYGQGVCTNPHNTRCTSRSPW